MIYSSFPQNHNVLGAGLKQIPYLYVKQLEKLLAQIATSTTDQSIGTQTISHSTASNEVCCRDSLQRQDLCAALVGRLSSLYLKCKQKRDSSPWIIFEGCDENFGERELPQLPVPESSPQELSALSLA